MKKWGNLKACLQILWHSPIKRRFCSFFDRQNEVKGTLLWLLGQGLKKNMVPLLSPKGYSCLESSHYVVRKLRRNRVDMCRCPSCQSPLKSQLTACITSKHVSEEDFEMTLGWLKSSETYLVRPLKSHPGFRASVDLTEVFMRHYGNPTFLSVQLYLFLPRCR